MRCSGKTSFLNLRNWNGTISAAVGVVDDSIERLVKPLPEDSLPSGPVCVQKFKSLAKLKCWNWQWKHQILACRTWACLVGREREKGDVHLKIEGHFLISVTYSRWWPCSWAPERTFAQWQSSSRQCLGGRRNRRAACNAIAYLLSALRERHLFWWQAKHEWL